MSELFKNRTEKCAKGVQYKAARQHLGTIETAYADYNVYILNEWIDLECSGYPPKAEMTSLDRLSRADEDWALPLISLLKEKGVPRIDEVIAARLEYEIQKRDERKSNIVILCALQQGVPVVDIKVGAPQ